MNRMPTPVVWFDRVVGAPRRPVLVATLAIGVIVVIAAVFSSVEGVIATAPRALALMLPVILSAVLGGRAVAYLVAVCAAGAFGFIVPPLGSLRVDLEQDLIALVVFMIVALVVTTVVGRRIELLAELERQHALLLRSVSHDFRTPLSVIRAASTELLDHEDHPADTRARLLALIGDETERLDRLVANLLDLSRIEAGALTPNRQSVDLAALVDSSVARLRRLFGDVDLAVRIDADARIVNADHTLMDQLVTNLLENAARHSPHGGHVDLRATRVGARLTLVVSDDGPGIPADRREALFEVFQAAGATAGSGVGLAICKAISEAHDGVIDVGESTSGGATFTVSMPA